MSESLTMPTTEQLLAQRSSTSLVELFTSLLRGKRTVVLSGFLFGIGAFALSFLLPVRFTASTQILPPQPARSTSASSMLSQLSAVSDGGSMASLGTAIQAKSAADMYAAMLVARPLVDALIERHHLVVVYGARTSNDARKALAARTFITTAKEGFITVAVADRDPDRAAAIANEYVDQLRVLMHGLALTESSQRRLFYETQLTKAKEELIHAELAYKQTQQSSRMIAPDLQARTLLAGAADLRAELTAKTLELERLRTFSTEANPQVQMAERALLALRGQLAQVDARGDSEHSGYSGGGLTGIPEAELSFLRAGRELKYQETLYEMLTRQYEASRIDEARDAPIVQVIEPAIAPEQRSSPNRRMIAFGAFAAGLLLGCMRVLLDDWWGTLGEDERSTWQTLRGAVWRW